MLQVHTGFTHQFTFGFFDEDGNPTSVDSPIVDIFTPSREKHVKGAALVSDGTGQYTHDFAATLGLTPGHWFALASGVTTSAALAIFSDTVPFEIVDTKLEPFWVSLNELKDYLDIPRTDRTRDSFNKMMLSASMGLVQSWTRREFGLRLYDEIIELHTTDRVSLRHYPLVTITAITPTQEIEPFEFNKIVQTVSGATVQFFFRQDQHDKDNGILRLTDSAGFELSYDGILVAIQYLAGFPTIPEAVRTAVLVLTSNLINLSTTEGLETIRLTDLSFAIDRKLFEGQVFDLLAPYRTQEIA